MPTDADCFTANLQQEIARQRPGAAGPIQTREPGSTRSRDPRDGRGWRWPTRKSRVRGEWLQVFANVGVAEVWAGIAVIVLLVVAGEASIRIGRRRRRPFRSSPLAGAAIGTLIGREAGREVGGGESRRSPGARHQPRQAAVSVPYGRRGWALPDRAAGSVDVARRDRAHRGHGGPRGGVRPPPAGVPVRRRAPPGWTNPVDWPPPSPGCSRSRGRDHALVLRRWIAALISLVTNPIALAVLASPYVRVLLSNERGGSGLGSSHRVRHRFQIGLEPVVAAFTTSSGGARRGHAEPVALALDDEGRQLHGGLGQAALGEPRRAGGSRGKRQMTAAAPVSSMVRQATRAPASGRL